MAEPGKNGVLNAARRTFGFLPLMRSRGSGGAPKSGEHLAKMNCPAHMARQDAAYDRAMSLINGNIFSCDAERRSSIYETVLKLLDIAIQAKLSISTPMAAQGGAPRGEDPILQYLCLLRDTIQAAYALVTHEMVLFKEEKQLSSFIGSEIANQFRSTDEIFTNSEMNIFHSVNDLSDMASAAIARHRDRAMRALPQQDVERYKKAFDEFNGLYSAYGVEAKDVPAKETQP